MRLFDVEQVEISNIRIETNAYYPRTEYPFENTHTFINSLFFMFPLPLFPLNTDGIDIAGRDIKVENIWYLGYDDAIVVKPGTLKPNEKRFGFDVGCTENILVQNFTIYWSVGGAAIGSV
eukprot:UN32228